MIIACIEASKAGCARCWCSSRGWRRDGLMLNDTRTQHCIHSPGSHCTASTKCQASAGTKESINCNCRREKKNYAKDKMLPSATAAPKPPIAEPFPFCIGAGGGERATVDNNHQVNPYKYMEHYVILLPPSVLNNQPKQTITSLFDNLLYINHAMNTITSQRNDFRL